MLNYITTYGLMLFYYSLFYIAVATSAKSNSAALKDILSGKGETGILFNRLIAGIFFLGVGAASIIAIRNINDDIFSPVWNEYYPLTRILAAISIITGIITGLKKIFSDEHSSRFLSSHLPLSYVFIRILFLIVYEFFFRGVMLFVMAEDFGFAAAVIINLILYVLMHWYNKEERYGSVLMGIVLCAVSIYYHSVWPAITIHLSLALSHEITLLIKYRSFTKKLSL